MKDKLGKELKVGDAVVFIAPGYRTLVIGTILRFTPQMAVIDYLNDWNYSTGMPNSIKQTSDQIVKI